MYDDSDNHLYQDDPGYTQELPPTKEHPPGVLSTSQAINLTCTIASLSALFALFLCFADQRSHAVRRFSVQSVGLGVIQLVVVLACWVLNALFGWVPILGPLLNTIMVVVFVAVMVAAIVFRVRMMLQAYRGMAYVLPIIGEKLRRFE